MNKGPGNPLALGLVLVGAAVMAIAAFLPLNEPAGPFGRVQHNTLIQNGGWSLIALAIGIAASGVRASQRRGNWLAFPIILCVLAGLSVFGMFTDKDSRTLYPVGLDGTVDSSKPGTVAPLGIALYVAGAGVAIALAGSAMLRQTKENSAQASKIPVATPAPTKKKCPDCAETILADAKVCKHCGYRFSAGAPPKPVAGKQEPAPEKSTKVKCNHCQHVQTVPVTQSTFTCEECNTKLKRRSSPAAKSS